MYWKFFYKILSLIDPEIAHNLTLKIIESGFLPKIKTKSIPLKVMNIQFQNPIGLAAGFRKRMGLLLFKRAMDCFFSTRGLDWLRPKLCPRQFMTRC